MEEMFKRDIEVVRMANLKEKKQNRESGCESREKIINITYKIISILIKEQNPIKRQENVNKVLFDKNIRLSAKRKRKKTK
mgnify:CR=1 FL=1